MCFFKPDLRMHFFFLFLWPVTRASHFCAALYPAETVKSESSVLGHLGAEVQFSRFVSYQNWMMWGSKLWIP